MTERMLEGERVRLRELRRSDLRVIAKHYNDADVVRHLAFWNAPFGEDDAQAFFDRAYAAPPEERAMAISRLPDDAFLGTLGLHRIHWRMRSATIGIAIWSPDGRGRGYGTEALGLLCDHAFGTLNLHRLQLSVFADNERAIRCYEKVGFVHEGRRRQAWYWDGAYLDILTMGMLRTDRG